MSVKQLRISASELVLGMFVSKLDRPWTQTPFPLQGFYLRNLDDIKLLKSHCNHVYIDVVKGSGPVATNLKTLAPEHKAKKHRGSVGKRSQPLDVPVAPLKLKPDTYKKTAPLKKEVKTARQLHQKVFFAVGEVLKNLERDHTVSMQETKRVASEMVDSVLRNPDAFSWLARVRDKDEYTYSHSVRSAVWAILFGRHIGLAKKELEVLSMGVLLKDVGKVMLPDPLLTKVSRSRDEQIEYEKFVEFGVEILRNIEGVESRVINVVKHHCERVNGTGFPLGLKGDKISLLGKIAGIVSFYDETTNPRGAAYPLAPSKAVALLYEKRDTEFQEELAVEFIRAIGLYPTGTLVELSTGEVAVVVEQNIERRLKPKIILVLDTFKRPLSKTVLLDLMEDDKRKQALVDAGKKTLAEVDKIEIATDLEPGSYDIDIQAIRDNYLFNQGKKGLFGLLGFKKT